MKPIAIIPARGGSKRIPRKNIKLFGGVPIISYPIQELIKSEIFESIYVSTDDSEIAEIAKYYGANVLSLRSKKLADEVTTTVEVIQAAVIEYGFGKQKTRQICCVYPTTPFLNRQDVQQGLQILQEGNWEYVISVNKLNFLPQRTFMLDPNKRVKLNSEQFENKRTQDIDPSYRDAAQFYWGQASSWLACLPIFSSNSTVIEIVGESAFDIDTMEDWDRAENLFKLQRYRLNR